MKESQATEQIPTTTIPEHDAHYEVDTAKHAAIRMLLLSPILDRIFLNAKLKAWHGWRMLALSDTTSFIPEFVEHRTGHVTSYASSDLTNHHLTLLVRNLMRWKARNIIKHWYMEAGRLSSIQSSLLRATSRKRYKDASSAFHL